MSREQRNNSGILSKNDRKQKDTHPDYTGECTIDGKRYFMDAWIKDGAKGKFMSFAFKEKTAKPEAKQPAFEDSLADDTIPF